MKGARLTNRVLHKLGRPAGGIIGGILLASFPVFAAPPPITIVQPWFRYVVPQVPAGGYLTLHNSSSAPAVLTGASSPACGMLMLHRSETSGGADRMVPIASVAVPPGGTISFAPGGYHLMCMQPRMTPGTSVHVTLTFQGGRTVSAAFPVFGAAGKPGGKS